MLLKTPAEHLCTFLSGLWILVTVAVSAQDNPDQKVFDKFYNKPAPSSSLRTTLNKFSLGVSVGYGRTFYSHDFSGMALIQKRDSELYAFNTTGKIHNNTIAVAYQNWFNDVKEVSNVPIRKSANDFLVSSDTAHLGYKAKSGGIPLIFTLHYAFDRYRIGLGASFEFHKIMNFNPVSFTDSLQSFKPPVSNATFKRYFLMLGGKVYRYYDYSLVVDTHIGILNPGNNFNSTVIKKGVYFNLGTSIEREFSEYFTAFVRPSFEIRNFTTILPEGLSVLHKQSAFFVSVGVSLRIPELPKCKIRNCHIQINHTHGGGRNWRSRMHPFFKKQNPHYGENYPKLLKYKRKNKNKVNPF